MNVTDQYVGRAFYGRLDNNNVLVESGFDLDKKSGGF
jgi:hypothetical protein